MTRRLNTLLIALVAGASCVATNPASASFPGAPIDARLELETYVELAYRAYSDAYADALYLQQTVNDFVDNANDDADEHLNKVRDAWIRSRPSYGQTEVFRFYEGPIDFGKQPDGTQGPEPLLNARPVNEAYMGYVQGNPHSGIGSGPRIASGRAWLVELNARDDEADVTTGFHASEFLLWGQDLNADGPGSRPARDFVGGGAAERR